jgi:hypothetical protein
MPKHIGYQMQAGRFDLQIMSEKHPWYSGSFAFSQVKRTLVRPIATGTWDAVALPWYYARANYSDNYYFFLPPMSAPVWKAIP